MSHQRCIDVGKHVCQQPGTGAEGAARQAWETLG